MEYFIRCGRYASCVHAGGLSCSIQVFCWQLEFYLVITIHILVQQRTGIYTIRITNMTSSLRSGKERTSPTSLTRKSWRYSVFKKKKSEEHVDFFRFFKFFFFIIFSNWTLIVYFAAYYSYVKVVKWLKMKKLVWANVQIFHCFEWKPFDVHFLFHFLCRN